MDHTQSGVYHLEFYTAYKDYFWMMETTEQLLEKAAMDVSEKRIYLWEIKPFI